MWHFEPGESAGKLTVAQAVLAARLHQWDSLLRLAPPTMTLRLGVHVGLHHEGLLALAPLLLFDDATLKEAWGGSQGGGGTGLLFPTLRGHWDARPESSTVAPRTTALFAWVQVGLELVFLSGISTHPQLV